MIICLLNLNLILKKNVKVQKKFNSLYYSCRPELVRPVTKLPSTVSQATGGTSVIRASPSHAMPVGQPHGVSSALSIQGPQATLAMTGPSGMRLHQAPDSVIQDGRGVLTIHPHVSTLSSQVITTSSQGHHEKIMDTGEAVVSEAGQSSAVILEKALTSASESKPDSEPQPQDLSNRFRPIERLGFSNEQPDIADMKSGNDGEGHVGGSGEQEGLLLRASSAAVREGKINMSDQATTIETIGIKKEETPNQRTVVKTEVMPLTTSYLTGPSSGAVIITQPRSHVSLPSTDHVMVDASSGKEEEGREVTWDQQQNQPMYHWSQLVPLITTPNRNSNNQQPPKNEIEVKPATNGDVITNGKGIAEGMNDGVAGNNRTREDGQERRESCSQETDFDMTADDDDVFLTDLDNTASTNNKRRTQSLGSFSGKEEPKSPRKVCVGVNAARCIRLAMFLFFIFYYDFFFFPSLFFLYHCYFKNAL